MAAVQAWQTYVREDANRLLISVDCRVRPFSAKHLQPNIKYDKREKRPVYSLEENGGRPHTTSPAWDLSLLYVIPSLLALHFLSSLHCQISNKVK